MALDRVLVRNVLHLEALLVRDPFLQEGGVLGRVGRRDVFALGALELSLWFVCLCLRLLFRLLPLRQRLFEGRRSLLDRVLLPLRLALSVPLVYLLQRPVDRVIDPFIAGGGARVLQVPRDDGLRLVLGAALLEQVDLGNSCWWQAVMTKIVSNSICSGQ